jgi:hypothetical protein
VIAKPYKKGRPCTKNGPKHHRKDYFTVSETTYGFFQKEVYFLHGMQNMSETRFFFLGGGMSNCPETLL